MRSAAIQATATVGAWVLPATWTGSDASTWLPGPVGRVLGEPAGQRAAGRSSAYDDVVVVRHHTSCSLSKDLSPGARPTASPSPRPAW
jgi:hypothetical protein